MFDLLQGSAVAGEPLSSVQAKLDAGIRNLTDPVRLLLDAGEAAALERALKQALPPQQQGREPWARILGRVSALRGALPDRRWQLRSSGR